MMVSKILSPKHHSAAAIVFLLVVLLPFTSFALCSGDFDADGDVDGIDLDQMASGRKGVVVSFLAADFGREDCPDLPATPLNQFTIGDSIGEGEAVYDDIGVRHHEAVWSTGFDAGDIVYSINERCEDSEPVWYFENDTGRDGIFNQADTGAEMADFEAQANAVVGAAAAAPSQKAGMISVLLGNNDVCSASSIEALESDFELDLFEQRFRAGLDVLAASAATREAFVQVSGIPAIYWLWNAKRSNLWCLIFAWPRVPCDILLDHPANDCGDVSSHLDPDTIHPDDGPNCVRRKRFHAAIRDRYNPKIAKVLLEYKIDGRLPNAYFVDIFDVVFGGLQVNSGDCFHPSIEGHQRLADEEWCRSPWGVKDPYCPPVE